MAYDGYFSYKHHYENTSPWIGLKEDPGLTHFWASEGFGRPQVCLHIPNERWADFIKREYGRIHLGTGRPENWPYIPKVGDTLVWFYWDENCWRGDIITAVRPEMNQIDIEELGTLSFEDWDSYQFR